MTNYAGKPIDSLAYPSITVCSSGYDLTAVEREIDKSFQHWLETKGISVNSNKTEDNDISTGTENSDKEKPKNDQSNEKVKHKSNEEKNANITNKTTNNVEPNPNNSLKDNSNHTTQETQGKIKQDSGSNEEGGNELKRVQEKGKEQKKDKKGGSIKKVDDKEKRKKRSVDRDLLFKEFSREVFGITDPTVSIKDIILAMSSQNPEASVKASGVQKALSSCSSLKRKKRQTPLSFTQGTGRCPVGTVKSALFCYTARPIKFISMEMAKQKCEDNHEGSLLDLSDPSEKSYFEELVTKGSLIIDYVYGTMAMS